MCVCACARDVSGEGARRDGGNKVLRGDERLHRFTSTLLMKRRPRMRTTSSLPIPRVPVSASRLGTYCASFMTAAIRSSKKLSFVLCAMAWLMASLIMWSPLRSVIMSLYTLGRGMSGLYSKWNSSVSKSLSGWGRLASVTPVSAALNVKSASMSFS